MLKIVASVAMLKIVASVAGDTPMTNFTPGVAECGNWQGKYTQLHSDIVSGVLPPRYMVSVAIESGTADRLSGAMTQFYLALLSNRAFTQYTYGVIPGFEAACDMPFFNWTHPRRLPDDVLVPLMASIQNSGRRGYRRPRRREEGLFFIPSQDGWQFAVSFMVNPQRKDLWWLREEPLSLFPKEDPGVPYVAGISNRGRVNYIFQNPHHKEQLFQMGLTPLRGFRCAFFSVCQPNAAVESHYGPYWRALQTPGALVIGVNVRVGDAVFELGGDMALDGSALLHAASNYFECGRRIQEAFAAPGQRVIWYLISDSGALRKAAKAFYGDKLLTDVDLHMVHPDCQKHNKDSCNLMNESMQHSIGQLVTFSMAHYHIYTSHSGFGRLGAWMSGREGNLFPMPSLDETDSCDPHKPADPALDALRWAGV